MVCKIDSSDLMQTAIKRKTEKVVNLLSGLIRDPLLD
jgi:hypothetical protein